MGGGEPDLALERELWAAGYRRVAGIDEAGRGAWAGPVVAAAVILPPGSTELRQSLAGVRDSKQLTAARREALLPIIQECSLTWGLGVVGPASIDAIGIVAATAEAMGLALSCMVPAADYLLVDYLSLPDQPMAQRGIPKGDSRVLSIAAASIVAKVSRDRILMDLDTRFPGYGLAQHKGYGTKEHRAALASRGPCEVHRMSYAPLREMWGTGG